ncbi:hypothetical protein [Streptomyces sp. SID1121]|uniref:hypothetical protein n=1 Tax=Streptomyces sp. SID1121 TaxID=3425888 RepID=UPI00405755CF
MSITMSTKVRVAAFVLALVASFGVAYGIGAAVGPLGGGARETHEPAPHGGHDAGDTGADGVMR